MKKVLMLVVLALASFSVANAQFYVGGSLGISHTKVDFGDADQSGTSFKILPEVGYQLNKHWAFGLDVGFTKGYAALGAFDPSDYKAMANAVISAGADISSDDMIDVDLKAFRFAPYARYIILQKGHFELFVDGILGFNFIKGIPQGASSAGLSEETDKYTSFEVNFRPGVSYAITDHIKLTAKVGSFGYQQLKQKDSDLKMTRFGLDVDGDNLLFGVLYNF